VKDRREEEFFLREDDFLFSHHRVTFLPVSKAKMKDADGAE
jgi:hypothetical protein